MCARTGVGGIMTYLRSRSEYEKRLLVWASSTECWAQTNNTTMVEVHTKTGTLNHMAWLIAAVLQEICIRWRRVTQKTQLSNLSLLLVVLQFARGYLSEDVMCMGEVSRDSTVLRHSTLPIYTGRKKVALSNHFTHKAILKKRPNCKKNVAFDAKTCAL